MMKWRFLIVDEEEVRRTPLASHLKALFPGCKVQESVSGADAVARLKQMEHLPVMAFYAHNTPDMNPIEFLSEARQLGTKTTLPTVVIGSDLGNAEVMSLYRLGIAVVLEAPPKRHEVKEAVRDFARAVVRAA